MNDDDEDGDEYKDKDADTLQWCRGQQVAEQQTGGGVACRWLRCRQAVTQPSWQLALQQADDETSISGVAEKIWKSGQQAPESLKQVAEGADCNIKKQ